MNVQVRLVLLIVLLFANLLTAPLAFAHSSGWHWNRYGATVTINVYNTTTYRAESTAAITDWDTKTILALPQVTSHSDIHLFDNNYGATGWASLYSFESYTTGKHLTHVHGRLNYYYSLSTTQKQAIFCKLLGHSFGLDSSNDGCMNGTLSSTVQHNWDDIYAMYRTSHH